MAKSEHFAHRKDATCLQFEPCGTFQKGLVSSQLLPVVKKGATVDLSSTFNFET